MTGPTLESIAAGAVRESQASVGAEMRERMGLAVFARESQRMWINPDEILPMHHALMGEVLTLLGREAVSVLEFGANRGKLLELGDQLTDTIGGPREWRGMDLSAPAVEQARKLGRNVVLGDDRTLAFLPSRSVDVAYTCSVLCHMPEREAAAVMAQLQRIARKGVVLLESATAEQDDDHEEAVPWWGHDYVSLLGSAVAVGAEWDHEGSGRKYQLWRWVRG